jgi:hypothetical protein
VSLYKPGKPISIEIENFFIPYVTPAMPAWENVEGYHLPKKEQKWRRPIFPSDEDVALLPKEERLAIIEKDFYRRIYGYWFMNNGVPTYITGSNYFFLTHWYMAALTKDGYGEYREAAKKWYYVIDICEKDPNCFGCIMMTQKRFGKTEMALAHLYNVAIGLDERALFGLQSLTAKEAKENLFKSRLMRSHKMIPNYLKPYSNETNSKKEVVGELRFIGQPLGAGKYKKGSENIIDHRPTLASAYQGKRPREIFLDEPGSVEEMDLIEWWTTVREQLALGTDKIYGRAFLPTTIEDMKRKGATAFEKIWKNSDPIKRDGNGRTLSGLYRYLKPYYLGREGCIDEYGNDLTEKAKKFRQNQLDASTPKEQLKIRHQYPESAEDAFGVIAGKVWEDDVRTILELSLKETEINKPPIKYVNFYESNNSISYALTKDVEGSVHMLEEPKAGVVYSLGIDSSTTDDETGSDEGSDIAAVITKGFDRTDINSYYPVAALSERPQKKESVYYKIYLLAKYFTERGAILRILGETNAGGGDCYHYLCNKGLFKYMEGTPKEYANPDAGVKTGKFWIYVNNEVKIFIHGMGNRFIRINGSGFRLVCVLKSLLRYGGPNEDIASAFLVSLMCFRDFDKPAKKTTNNTKSRPVWNATTGSWD